ncbi:hypothetical protein P5673_023160 [Acropora cervicornis]|uniref:Uncharacterized protein n=1 Tax=Acropora cervicornis TaxID=6130 RepID=A0AAD9UZ10_ACRCE|nr:hypothetical protein P5673_023160 [Acropora cervicornis]
MKCPICSVSHHSCHVDGDMKLYRYHSSGRQYFVNRRPAYYGDLFIANKDDVDSHIKNACAKQPKLKVIWGGRWQVRSACSTSEEVEQINSHMSRCGNTTKYMLPESQLQSLSSFFFSGKKKQKTKKRNSYLLHGLFIQH